MIARFRRPSLLHSAAGLALAAILGSAGLTGAGEADSSNAPSRGRSPAQGSEGSPKERRRDLYGDPLPEYAMARMGTTRLRCAGSPRALCFSPDGKLLASAEGTRIRLWEAETGKRSDTWPPEDHFPPPAWARGVAFSPDGKRLAAVVIWLDSDGGSFVIVRDLASGASPLRIKVNEAQRVAFSPDGRSLLVWGGTALWTDKVVGSKGILRLYDAATGEAIREFRGHDGVVSEAGFASDGKTLASSSQDNTVRIWDAETGAELRRFTILEQVELDGGRWLRACVSMAYAPNGRWVALSVPENAIQLRELPSGAIRHTLRGHGDKVTALAFSADSGRLASGAWDHSVRIWDVGAGLGLHELKGHLYAVECVAFSADGSSLASGSQDLSIEVWNVESGEPRHQLVGHLGRIEDAALSPDGMELSTAGADGLRIWEARTGRHLSQVAGLSMVSCVGYSPDGKWLAAGCWDKSVHLWSVEEGQPIAGTERSLEGHSSSVRSMAFSPNGGMLATGGGSGDSRIILWNTQDGRQIRTLGPWSDDMLQVVFSPDGRLLAGMLGHRRVLIWQLFQGGWVREIGSDQRLGSIASMAFTPDGSALVTAGEGTAPGLDKGGGQLTHRCGHLDAIRLWSLETGAQVSRFQPDPLTLPQYRAGSQCVARSVACVATSPDGALLVSSEQDGRIFVYDTRTSRFVGELAGHDAPATRLIFSRDGRYLVSTSHDDLTSLVWDLSGLRR